jgi:hypothetical protein
MLPGARLWGADSIGEVATSSRHPIDSPKRTAPCYSSPVASVGVLRPNPAGCKPATRPVPDGTCTGWLPSLRLSVHRRALHPVVSGPYGTGSTGFPGRPSLTQRAGRVAPHQIS